MVLAAFVVDGVSMEANGGYVTVEWEPFEIAGRIVAVVLERVAEKLAGEPLL